tara:strand:+ start:176 stop:346 length:171 start_codon:yes stop_codon:yes gene_type:complete
MNNQKKPLDPELVPCDICLKEIPISEAKSEEAVDYVLYYCSLECYAKWADQSKKKD